MERLSIPILKALYEKMDGREFRTSKTAIIRGFAQAKLKETGNSLKNPRDMVYYVLSGRKEHPSLEEHKALNDLISSYYIYHFGEESMKETICEILNESQNQILSPKQAAQKRHQNTMQKVYNRTKQAKLDRVNFIKQNSIFEDDNQN